MSEGDPWLDEPQLDAWITLAAFLETVPAQIESQLKRDSGINLFEYTVLAMLSEQADRSLVMSDLADVAFASLSRLSHAAKRLEARGWIERRTGGGGRRHTTVHLTDAGLDAMTSAAPLHVANVRALLVDPLSARELATFTRLSRKILAAADPELDRRLDEMIPEVVRRNLGDG